MGGVLLCSASRMALCWFWLCLGWLSRIPMLLWEVALLWIEGGVVNLLHCYGLQLYFNCSSTIDMILR